MFGTLRAGCTVVNVNPLYTARELEHQLKDSGAEGDRHPRELRLGRCSRCAAKTPVKHVVVTSLGEMLGLKGLIVNLVVRKVKKMVPAYEPARRDRVQGRAWAEEAARRSTRRRSTPRGHRFPAVHRRHHRRVEGRDAAPPQHHRRAARSTSCLARAGIGGERAIDHHRAAALSHLLADGELPGDDGGRRRERADHQSARYPGLRQGARRSTSTTSSPGSTRCSTRCSTTRISASWISAA